AGGDGHRDGDLIATFDSPGATRAIRHATKLVGTVLTTEEQGGEMNDVRDLAGEGQHAPPARRDQYRDRRRKRTVQRDVVHVHDASVERDALAAPHRAHDIDAFANGVDRVWPIVAE